MFNLYLDSYVRSKPGFVDGEAPNERASFATVAKSYEHYFSRKIRREKFIGLVITIDGVEGTKVTHKYPRKIARMIKFEIVHVVCGMFHPGTLDILLYGPLVGHHQRCLCYLLRVVVPPDVW